MIPIPGAVLARFEACLAANKKRKGDREKGTELFCKSEFKINLSPFLLTFRIYALPYSQEASFPAQCSITSLFFRNYF